MNDNINNEKIKQKITIILIVFILILVIIYLIVSKYKAITTPDGYKFTKEPFYFVNKIYPKEKQRTLPNGIVVNARRINDTNCFSDSPKVLKLDNGEILIDTCKELELFNPKNYKFTNILTNGLVENAFKYKKNEYLLRVNLDYPEKDKNLIYKIKTGKIYPSSIKYKKDKCKSFFSQDETPELYNLNLLNKSLYLKSSTKNISTDPYDPLIRNCRNKHERLGMNCRSFYFEYKGFCFEDYSKEVNTGYVNFSFDIENFEALTLRDDRLLFIGNMGIDNINYKTIEMYDFKTQKMSVVGEMQAVKHYTKSIELPDNRILIIGGIDQDSNDYIDSLTAEILDIKTNKITLEADIKANIMYKPHGAFYEKRFDLYQLALFNNNIVLITGEYLYLYDISNKKFYNLDHLTIPRVNHVVINFEKNKALIIGGFETKDRNIYNNAKNYCNLAYFKNWIEWPVSICNEAGKFAEVIEIKVKDN